MKVYVTHYAGDNKFKDIYGILKNLNAVQDGLVELILPHDTEEYIDSLPIIKTCDLIIVLAHKLNNSIECGIEVGYSKALDKELLLLRESNQAISRSIYTTFNKIYSYKNREDLDFYLNRHFS